MPAVLRYPYEAITEDTDYLQITIKRYLIEVKPKKQTIAPKVQKKKTKSYIYEVCEYAKNQAKWKAATEYCKDRLWEFKVLTENELGITK